MSRIRHLFPLAASLLLAFLVAVPVLAQTAVKVERGVICTQIVEREPAGVDSTFAPDVDRLYCFTQITGAQDPTTVTHVWYFGDTERARVELNVRSVNWRTNSSKQVMPHETGAWRVDVLDSSGNVLKTIRFTITG
jgi:hypothetical protein